MQESEVHAWQKAREGRGEGTVLGLNPRLCTVSSSTCECIAEGRQRYGSNAFVCALIEQVHPPLHRQRPEVGPTRKWSDLRDQVPRNVPGCTSHRPVRVPGCTIVLGSVEAG